MPRMQELYFWVKIGHYEPSGYIFVKEKEDQLLKDFNEIIVKQRAKKKKNLPIYLK